MSTLPDNELDLEKLFLPSWAQEPSSAKNYENYRGDEGDRPRRRESQFGNRPRREGGQGGPRREGGQGPRREGGRRPEGQRGPGQGQGRGGNFRDRGGDRRREGGRGRGDQPQERREPLPLPEVNVALVPEEKGVESLARQIKMAGRAYPLFDIAQMILQKPERHNATFSVKRNAEGKPVQPLFLCALDDTLWLSDEEAVDHVLRRHFATFYQTERTPTEPPKGKYTFVAQCGMSGVVFGPPNLHDYQEKVRKLHAERFSRMPFDVYKSRVKIVRDEETVKKWVEEQSWKTEYVTLNVPEPVRHENLEAVTKHFRETHKEAIIKEVESHTVSGTAARNLRCAPLARAYRVLCEDQRRFPLQIATVLSQQFASHGLQFFKVNRTVTHVCVARPHYLDLEAVPVSEGVRKIVEFLNTHPKATRRQVIESLAPSPAVIAVPAPQAPEAQAAAEPQAEASSAAATAEQAPAAQPRPEPSPEQSALVADLHWLIHQGHVIEFANGIMETAKKPVPKPPKPEKKPEVAQPAAAPQPTTQPQADAPVSQGSDATVGQTETVPEPAPEAQQEVLSPAAENPALAEQPATEEQKNPEIPGEPAAQTPPA